MLHSTIDYKERLFHGKPYLYVICRDCGKTYKIKMSKNKGAILSFLDKVESRDDCELLKLT